MIQFEKVTYAYEKGKTVLSEVSFKIEEGETVGLIGANGAGKSTVMKLLLGLTGPGAGKTSGSLTEGRILVDGLEVIPRNLAGIRRKLGFVLQNSDNQMFMPTVYDDMMFAPMNYGMTREEAEKKVDEVLARLELTALRDRYNHKLSGGEKKMAAIAAVLAMEPGTVLMDEPTSGLDPYNRRLIIRTVRSMRETKLIASHDLDMILDCCSRVILLSEGRIAADGRAEDVLRDRALLEANHLELPLSLSRS